MSIDLARSGPAAVILWAITALSVAAAEPSLQVTIPESTLTVGDRLEVDLQAHGGDGWLWGELTVRVADQGQWAVVDGPREIEGARPPAWSLTLAVMDTGELTLPELSVTARSPDGDVSSVTVPDPPVVHVASVLPPEGEVDPAPLRAPIGVHGFPWEWLVPILMVLIPALGAQYWWLRRRRAVDGDDAGSQLPPLEQLELLTGKLVGRVGKEPAELICDHLAGGYRRYFERRTGEPAIEMTSFELRVLARRNRWPEPVQRALHRVMQTVDGVRFGRRTVPDGELDQTISAAIESARGLELHLAPSETETGVEAAS